MAPVRVQDASARLAKLGQAAAEATTKLDRLYAIVENGEGDDLLGDVQARKTYLRSIIDAVEGGETKIRIVGQKATLRDVMAGKATNVRGFDSEWRAKLPIELIAIGVGNHRNIQK